METPGEPRAPLVKVNNADVAGIAWHRLKDVPAVSALLVDRDEALERSPATLQIGDLMRRRLRTPTPKWFEARPIGWNPHSPFTPKRRLSADPVSDVQSEFPKPPFLINLLLIALMYQMSALPFCASVCCVSLHMGAPA